MKTIKVLVHPVEGYEQKVTISRTVMMDLIIHMVYIAGTGTICNGGCILG